MDTLMQRASAASEILSPSDLVAITGYHLPRHQIRWLDRHGWRYVLSAARRPVVGRLYARLQLAGMPGHMEAAGGDAPAPWALDLGKVS